MVLLLVGVGVPVGILASYSLRETSFFVGAGPGPTLTQYNQILHSSALLRTCVSSLVVGLVVAVIVSALSFVLAYGITFRFRRRWQLVALGLVIAASAASYVVRVYAWGTVLGTNGLINESLIRLGLINEPLGFLLFGYFAIGLTMVYVYMPIGVLLVYAAMQEIDPRSLEASRDLGAGRWRTVVRVVAPQARVGLMTTFGLTLIFACSDFVTPSLVGGVRGTMVGTVIFSTGLGSGDYPSAAALAFFFVALALLALLLLWSMWKVTGRARVVLARNVDQVAARVAHIAPARLTGFSFSRAAACFLLFYLIAPTLMVVFFSFNAGGAVGLPFTGFTLDWYSSLFSSTGFTAALSTSFQIGIVAVLAGIAIGVPAAFTLARSRSAASKALQVAVAVPYIVPGVLIGMAMLTFAVMEGIPLGKSLTMLAHVVVVAPVITLVIRARLSGMDPRLTDAARDLGSTPRQALRKVTLPLILPALLGAALIGLAYSLDDLIRTVFTIGPDNTLPIWMFSQARQGFNASINALAVLVMSGTVGLFALAALFLRSAMIPGGRSERGPNE
jgi:ABC-type spermidine/putrescine transport system permease subunit II